MKTTLKTSVLLCVMTLSLVSLGHGQRPGHASRPKIPASQATQARQGCISFHAELACGNGRFVAVGSDGKLHYSSDGIEWHSVFLPVNDFIRGVTFGNGQFVAVGGAYASRTSIILTSRNGHHWTVEQCSTKRVLYSVTHGADRFIAVGEGGVILSSRSGKGWREETAPTAATLAAVTFGKGVFVAGGDDGLLLTSTDGVRWAPQSSGTRSYISRIVFKADKFYAGSTVLQLVSDNGIAWSPLNLGETEPQFWSATTAAAW